MVVYASDDIVRFTPSHRASEDKPPVYLLCPLKWKERRRYQSAVTREGAGSFASDADMIKAVRRAILEKHGDQAGDIIDLIDKFEALPRIVEGEEPPETQAVREQYAVVLNAAIRYDPRVADLVANRQYYIGIAGPIAAQYTLRGWVNVPLEFELRSGLVPDELIDQLDRRWPADLNAIGTEAIRLIYLSGDDVKNSDSPLPSDGGQETSLLH